MKTILILHGWPQYRLESYFLSKHFKNNGYEVTYPNLFDERFEFNLGNMMYKVKESLDGKIPDAIVGISLGGLIAPYIATQYPNSKLVFVASAASLQSKSKVFNLVLWMTQIKFFMLIPKLIFNLPNDIFEKIYRLVNPFKGDENDREEYEEDTKTNVEFIKSIPIEKEMEIIKFVKDTNNKLLLKGLKNKALIFSGRDDLMMPLEKGRELNDLLENSKLIINDGEHFNVFSEKDLETVEAFL